MNTNERLKEIEKMIEYSKYIGAESTLRMYEAEKKGILLGIKEERGRIIKLIMSQPTSSPELASVQTKIINLICGEQ